MRDYGKTQYRNTLRKRLAKEITQKTYGRRNMVESTVRSIKCKFGASLSSIKFSAQRAAVWVPAQRYLYKVQIYGQYPARCP